MNILWICNNVLTDFCTEFGLKWNFSAGWATGLLHVLKTYPEFHIGFCFPLIDEFRMKNGIYNGHTYYSFHMNMNDRDYDESMRDEFVPFIDGFAPDVVHIWGTERNHARAAFEACTKLGIKNNVLIYIQGIAAAIGKHYAEGVPQRIMAQSNQNGIAEIKAESECFNKVGITEKKVIEQADFITGRTEWDQAYVKKLNPKVKYLCCNEILRDEFYKTTRKWMANHCKRHTIFMSQAHYPLKGFHFLIRALPLILAKYPDTEVRVGGFLPMGKRKDGTVSIYGKWLDELMAEYEVQKHICFLGVLDERQMVEEYLNANVYVLPSTIDNSPNSVAEAMILGTPIVASHVGGVPSIVRHEVDGFLYPHDNRYMLAHYIIQIFNDDTLASCLSEAGRKIALVRHDPETVYERMREIYHIVANGLPNEKQVRV